ncbi:unnamed protein product [Nippostrongylus brasiliensis]|uniref:tRNA pseudouridine synthase n=1 Tax=Nippostrongylus brasiliensis TaxID=27835 RepID=A0A0N4YHL5_NIPBR|nr:unnamed protein product [Nippostrongylus brasiliensis]
MLVNFPVAHLFIFWFSYDGSRFPEMATGGTGFGVVDMLYQTISDSLFGARSNVHPVSELLKLSPSSRTDAHVHALRNALVCQVPVELASLDATKESKRYFMNNWNDNIEDFCPGGMKVLDLHSISAGFCVRRHVAYRKYTYRLAVCKSWDLWESLQRTPSRVCFSEKHYAWRLPPGFSPEKASDACNIFEGEHVVGSFFKHTARDKRKEIRQPSAVRNIWHCQLSAGESISIPNDFYDYYNVTIVARSFVREQIRRMMSCVVFRGYDRLPLKTIRWLLSNPCSSNFYDMRIPIAPPQGLFLTDVVFPPEQFRNPIPFFRHTWDHPRSFRSEGDEEEDEDEVLFENDSALDESRAVV